MLFADTSSAIQDELLATARRAAAKATRMFPGLAVHRDDVTQNAYLAMLGALAMNHPERGNLFAFVFTAAYRFIVCGWLDRDDYRFRHAELLELTDKLPETGHIECPDTNTILHELLSAAKLSDFEMAVVTEYFWMGRSTQETADHLGYTQDWTSKAKNKAIDKIRLVIGMPALVMPRGGRIPSEYSTRRGARSMRKQKRLRMEGSVPAV